MSTYFPTVFVHTMYSTSCEQGFKKANADVLSHTQSRFFARKRYDNDTICPLSFKTVKLSITKQLETFTPAVRLVGFELTAGTYPGQNFLA